VAEVCIVNKLPKTKDEIQKLIVAKLRTFADCEKAWGVVVVPFAGDTGVATWTVSCFHRGESNAYACDRALQRIAALSTALRFGAEALARFSAIERTTRDGVGPTSSTNLCQHDDTGPGHKRYATKTGVCGDAVAMAGDELGICLRKGRAAGEVLKDGRGPLLDLRSTPVLATRSIDSTRASPVQMIRNVRLDEK
jgi:hypothetical protein